MIGRAPMPLASKVARTFSARSVRGIVEPFHVTGDAEYSSDHTPTSGRSSAIHVRQQSWAGRGCRCGRGPDRENIAVAALAFGRSFAKLRPIVVDQRLAAVLSRLHAAAAEVFPGERRLAGRGQRQSKHRQNQTGEGTHRRSDIIVDGT